jgi:hypothetical protein
MKRAGRPSKYSDEKHRMICEALKMGNTRKDSAAYGGISQDTFAAWLRVYPDFADDVAKSEAAVAMRNVALIQKAAQAGTWQAAAWWLERRRASDFSTRHEVTGSEGGPIEVVVRFAEEGE